MPYVKLDTGILDSTLWVQDAATCKVFITMLAMCKPSGICEATAPGIARRANVSLEDTRKALAVLESPDDDSRSVAEEGRRIVRVDGGYQIVNYLKYRDKDHTAAQRMQRFRAKHNQEHGNELRRNGNAVTRNVTEADQIRSDQIRRKDLKSVSSKPAQRAAVEPLPDELVAIKIPTNCTGLEMPISKAKVAEWEEAYPSVDVPATLREIRQWCIDNPTRRKTANGMHAFVSRWLAREQNR